MKRRSTLRKTGQTAEAQLCHRWNDLAAGGVCIAVDLPGGIAYSDGQLSNRDITMDQQFEDGMKIRKQVMGEQFVDAAFEHADDFTLPIQEFITRNAWGTVWCRDGLEMPTRSLITLSMLIALGRNQEIKGHVRGALNNGVTPEQLREVLLHAAIYCGAPLALDATRAVQEVLATHASV